MATRPATIRLHRENARIFSDHTKSLEIPADLNSLVSRSTKLLRRVDQLSREVTFTVTTRTVSGQRLQAQRGLNRRLPVPQLLARVEERGRVAERLRVLGFRVIHEGWFSVVARGPAALARSVLKADLIVQARARPGRVRSTQIFSQLRATPVAEDLFVAPRHSLSLRAEFSADADDVVFTPPPLYFQPVSPTPAPSSYRVIDPDKVRAYLNVPDDATGAGAVVGMIDTGFFKGHPCYESGGFDLVPTPTVEAADPHVDPEGHGTAMAFNTFVVAPGCRVLGFKRDPDIPPHVSLQLAGDAGVDIVTCSWGYEHEQVFEDTELTIRKLVEDGKVVLFASGNGVHAWPACMPEVIAVGGVHGDETDAFEGSNYASGFRSTRYPGRLVPDVAGLCGHKPLGIYLMLPCQPASALDKAQAAIPRAAGERLLFPEADETEGTDGWAGASGTSAATAQVAGVAALLVAEAKRQGRHLTNADVRDIMTETARPVSEGLNAFGVAAGDGIPNVLAGYGLVDASAALARLNMG